MNCPEILERINTVASQPLSETERQTWASHLASCDECDSALGGAEALQVIRNQSPIATPAGLFEKVLRQTTRPARRLGKNRQFWLGAGFGGAVAAAIVTAVVTLGLLGTPAPQQPATAEFLISMQESRELNLAIDSERPLDGARISVLLPDGVQLAGYSGQRQLAWTDDLAAGVNKLTLPLIAISDVGGQLIVKLDHEDSHQVFLIRLKIGA